MASHKEKTDRIGCNPHKNLVRADIVSQVMEWVAKSKSPIHAATLPASSFAFEHHLNHSLSLKGIPCQFSCAEANRDEYQLACEKKPSFAGLMFGSMNELLFGILKKDDYGLLWRFHHIGGLSGGPFYRLEPVESKIWEREVYERQVYHKEDIRSSQDYYNVVWADYCCSAYESCMTECIQSMQMMDSGLFYVTFSLLNRQTNGMVFMESLAKEAGITLDQKIKNLYLKSERGDKTSAIALCIQICMNARLKKAGINAKMIYNIKYNGNGNLPMLTLGWEIKTKFVKTIHSADRTFNVRKATQAMLYVTKIKPNKRFFPPFASTWTDIKNPEYVAPTPVEPVEPTPVITIVPISIVQAYYMQKATPEQKASIGALYASGLTTRQVAARFPALRYRTVASICAHYTMSKK